MNEICTKSGTNIAGFKVPIGAIYGRRGKCAYVCTDYTGFNTGSLSIFTKTEKTRWRRVTYTSSSWQFQEVASVLSKLGRIPKIYKDYGKIVGEPRLRKINYKFQRSEGAVRSLIGQQTDNSDRGGHAVRNGDSYRSIHKDMIRKGVKMYA